MTNYQTKCSIVYEKSAMRAGDDERMIMSGLIYVCDRKSFTDSITCVGVKPVFF